MGLPHSEIGGGIQFKCKPFSPLCYNLRRKNGGVPNAAAYACYATRDGKKAKSLATAYQKAKDPQWFENTERLKGVTLDTKLTFVVLDSTAPFLRPVKLALSKPYTVSDLLRLRDEAAAQNGDGTAPTFAVPLTLRGDPSNEASLVLALFDYMSDKERREFHAQVESNWKAKQRKDRETELRKLDKELRMLSADIPGSTTSKTFIDIASGLLASITPLFDADFKEDSRLVTDLLSSYRSALSQIRFVTTDLSADLSIQLYGKVCLEISSSVRFLERCLRKPALMNELQVVQELRSSKARFDEYPQTTGSPIGSRNFVFQERATLRKILNDSQPTLRNDLQPSLDAEPTKLPLSLSTRHSLATVQDVSSWALLTSFAELKRLLWLTGPAGCGKTQLTTSLIDAFGRVGVPTAYFTFNNHSTDSNEPPSLACMTRTISFQLAAYVDGLAVPVSSAVKNAGELEKSTFREVFEKLVVTPLQVIPNIQKKVDDSTDGEEVHRIFRRPEPVVIILDDIDQCTPAQLDELLPVLEEALPKLQKEARIMLCSRELASVRTTFATNTHASIVEYTSPSDNDMIERLNGASAGQSSAGSSSGINSAMWTSTTVGLPSGRRTPQTPSRSSSIRWSSDHHSGSSGNGSGGTSSRRNSVTDGKGKGPASRPGSLGNIAEMKGILAVRR